MKKIITNIMLLVFAVSACEKAPEKNTAVTVNVETAEPVQAVIPELMKGELDEFHPDSKFESIRKKKLTDLGSLNTQPPEYTPDAITAIKVLNIADLTPYTVDVISSRMPWRPKYPFDFENDLNALKRLYDSHNLDTVVDMKNKSSFETVVALMVYTHNFLEGGTMPEKESDPGPSAEIITKLRRENGIGGTSKHYSALFCQLALTCGYNARLIGMHTFNEDGRLVTNNICEIFIAYWDKWVAFDVFNRCTYYERNKIPQSALELHNIAVNKNYNAINTFSQFGEFADIISVREKLLPAYKHIYMWRMNDILSKSPKGGTISWHALYQAHLVWEDVQSPVSDGRFDELIQFNDSGNPEYPLDGVKYVVHEINQFNWQLNSVDIHLERIDEDTVKLYFDTVTPNFNEFIITGMFENLKTSDNTYNLIDFMGTTTILSENDFGLIGRYSRVEISP